MGPIRRQAACNKALRPTVGSKLSPSGDVATQTVAFARRFADSAIVTVLLHRSSSGDCVVTAGESSCFPECLSSMRSLEHETDLLRAHA
jgi:hypothetical protein